MENEIKLEKVRQFVDGHFRGKYRKGNHGDTLLPYMYHCYAVETLLWKWGAGNYIRRAAALCHDLMEEKDIPFAEISAVAGTEAAVITSELTFLPDVCSKDEYMQSFATKSLDALIVKLADRFCNVLDFLVSDPAYARKYYRKALPLMMAYMNRKEELEAYVGVDVVRNIENTKKTVQMLLGRDEMVCV